MHPMFTNFPKIRRLFCTLLLLQCSLSHAKQVPTKPLLSDYPISAELTRWNRRQAIPLKMHQLVPIADLEKHPEKKGLVIYHELGSGKTLLSIGFAERYPDRPVFIVAPGFLEAHWREHLDKCGVQNKGRYRFFSHANPEGLLKEDLSKAIILLDESHRWIEAVRTYNKTNSVYGALYYKLRAAHRILALTGTMIYTDAMDLVYHLNLVSGKDLFSFNHEIFRLKYSKIHTMNAYWRGHVMESTLMYPMLLIAPILRMGLSFLAQGLPFQTFSEVLSLTYPLAQNIGILQNLSTPFWKYPGRVFDTEKLKDIITPYISYYSFEQEARFYPHQFSSEQQLHYNYPQMQYLFKFANSTLNQPECGQLLKDAIDVQRTHREHATQNDLINLNSSGIQNDYKYKMGAGREIGNLLFSPENAPEKIIFPQKFKGILRMIEESKGPVVVYSHYYYNGLLLFKQFLDASDYKTHYRIYHPEMSKEQHSRIVQEFNTSKIKILLLHPDITEGISLKGARQLHFLEMPYNAALSKQIIGRTIRFGSHLHLPKHEQNVTVFFWKYSIPYFNLQTQQMLREDWYHGFTEMNYYGPNAQILDKNSLMKKRSPDDKAHVELSALNANVEIFRHFIKYFSIENMNYSSNQTLQS